jgi:two-component system, chemotaxis family, protein-glutamate methylesterase/glutaminase
MPRAEKMIIVGASTGGTEALREFLCGLPAEVPPVLIVQHMPEMFTRSFAQRLNNAARMQVKEAEANEKIQSGVAYVAPGHSHMMLRATGRDFYIDLSQAPPVNRHRPAVDVLFRSAANLLGPNAIGVILTGMGKDGAAGMLEMRQAGAYNFAQDENSCVVFGMPKEAIAVGAAHEVVPLGQIAGRVLQRLTGKS